MASLAEQLTARKAKLQHVQTTVKRLDGQVQLFDGEQAIVDEERGFGFVVDIKPDMGCPCMWSDWLFMSSQDVPQNWEEVKKRDPKMGGITRILNVAAGVGRYALAEGVERVDISLLDTPEQRVIEETITEQPDHVAEETIIPKSILPSSSMLAQCLRWLHQWHVREKRKVLVHCNAGVSRSSTVVIAWLIVLEGMSFEDALAHCKGRRTQVKPNEGFTEQLKELAGRVQKVNVSKYVGEEY